ncbi:MAG: nuclear transport factor 2 family protein [bacterium]|nr:nuclear transport factor 2 family protein [bacterium]
MKAKIAWSLFRTLVLFVLLFLATRWLTNPYPPAFETFDSTPYGLGNSSEDVRAEIIDRLRLFQEGYSARDSAAVEEFADTLLSSDNTLILGTMPREIYVGHEAATTLIRDDWEFWGDCTFLIDQAHVSNQGDVAWIATVGYVEFDISRFLVLPLRLTGTLVNEDGAWRFQVIQYQFDLDLRFSLLLVVLLGLLTCVSLIAIPIQALLIIRKQRIKTSQ